MVAQVTEQPQVSVKDCKEGGLSQPATQDGKGSSLIYTRGSHKYLTIPQDNVGVINIPQKA